MIGQYLPNNNETATVAFHQKICQLNSLLDYACCISSSLVLLGRLTHLLYQAGAAAAATGGAGHVMRGRPDAPIRPGLFSSTSGRARAIARKCRHKFKDTEMYTRHCIRMHNME
jgi:hypothetical protein